MKRIETDLSDLTLFELDAFGDSRGSFMEVHRQSRYEQLGLPAVFVQDNVSRSARNVIRGLHGQNPNPQGKLICVLIGQIWDVAIDARVGSPTFGQWRAFELSQDNHRQLFIPAGFLHGFLVQSDEAMVHYKCTHPYEAAADFAVRWNDPELGIAWPCEEPILSPKDANAPFLAEVRDRLARY